MKKAGAIPAFFLPEHGRYFSDPILHFRRYVAVYVHGHLVGGVAETILHFLWVDAFLQELGGVRAPESVLVRFLR